MKRFIPQLGLLLGIVVLSIACAVPAGAIPRTEKELRSIMDKLVKTTVIYGQIPSISQPRYLTVGDASMSLEDRDPVFVVFFPTGPRLYPQKIMVWHEVLNEVIDGHAYCITYAPITGCLAAYDARVDGINLIFDNDGRLFNNNSVLVDRNTGSLWLQMLGMSFDGPLFGRGLKMIPAWWTTWGMARKVYPKAPVLGTPLKDRKPYGRDPYGSYFSANSYYSDERILYPLMAQDRRLHPKTRVLGMEYENIVFAIDESYVQKKRAVNFFVGPEALVAFVDPRLNVVRVFNRKVWDKPLLFKMENGTLVDTDTKTRWSFDGKALEGNLSGASLVEITGIYAFWFGWAAFHPETMLIPGPTVVPDSALETGVPGASSK